MSSMAARRFSVSARCVRSVASSSIVELVFAAASRSWVSIALAFCSCAATEAAQFARSFDDVSEVCWIVVISLRSLPRLTAQSARSSTASAACWRYCQVK
jgi:hypothetical protein